jgi:N-methylhydantoinase A/oxoprolinase/acetone carboxylase beta subunit
MGLLVTVDNGGTLTDVCAFDGRRLYHTKTLTTPHDLTECLISGLGRLSRQILGCDEDDVARLIPMIDCLRYSTTQGTNAVVQRTGPRIGILTDQSGLVRHARSIAEDMFDALVGQRILAVDPGSIEQHALARHLNDLVADGANRIVVIFSGNDASKHEQTTKSVLYQAFPRHLLGAVPMLFSSDLSPNGTEERRAWTAILNSFLHPAMERFLYNTERKLRTYRNRNPLLIYRNDGGTTRVAKTVAIKTYSSGPRGGAEASIALAKYYDLHHVISIDIGGTTTDIANYLNGRVEERDLGEIERVPVGIPLAKIQSIGVGGSSILRVVEGRIQIGPESVGSVPGPACFGRGGTAATITDAYVVSGLLEPETYFGGALKLDRARAERALIEHVAKPLGLDLPAAVDAITRAYDLKIAEALPRDTPIGPQTCLLAFGGAGPMNACGVADAAGIRQVLIPKYAAVFSAFGIGFSDIEHRYSAEIDNASPIDAVRGRLREQARRGMRSEGFELADCIINEAFVGESQDGSRAAAAADQRRRLEVRVTKPIEKIALPKHVEAAMRAAEPIAQRQVSQKLPVYSVELLNPGDQAVGPCLAEEAYFTAFIPEGWQFAVTSNGDLSVNRK